MAAGLRPRRPSSGSGGEVQVDWEALWLDVQGPSISADDLATVSDIFNCLDLDSDGLLRRGDLALFLGSFADFCEDLVDIEGDSASLGDSEGNVDPKEWIAFNSAAVCACGYKAWRKALVEQAAVYRISQSVTPEDDTWIIRRSGTGAIWCKWFSKDELQPDERLACRALKGASGWRCLSCEAEALDSRRPLPLSRATSTPMVPGVELLAPPMPESSGPLLRVPLPPVDLSRATTQPHSGPPSTKARRWSEAGISVLQGGHGNTPRCSTLVEMLSHRAMRPLPGKVSVGDEVMITNIAKCDGLKTVHLGMTGTVVQMWVPEMCVVKKMWCLVELSKEDERKAAIQVAVPLQNTANPKVKLHPGDVVEAYRPVNRGQRTGERSNVTSQGTVLQLPPARPHLVHVSFGPGDEVSVPLNWVIRLEMSAWTQVLRQAPHSTVMFLLCDLQLKPGTPQDLRELENRVRRDFEPHGRFRYVGAVCESHSGSKEEPFSPGSTAANVVARAVESPKYYGRLDTGSLPLRRPSDASTAGSSRPSSRSRLTRKSSTRMAMGDCGKVLSFDLEEMKAEVMPDRKKHLRLRIGLEELAPDPHVLQVAASSGPTRMHAFDEDPPILAAIKMQDVRGLRQLLAAVPRGGMVKALLEDAMDADGNLAFHAAVYTKSIEIWRIVWSALDNAPGVEEDIDDAKERALAAVDDWGRTPLWIALEEGHTKLVSLLLGLKASVQQEAPVLPESGGADGQDFDSSHEFCGGPGMVAQGTEFEVTFYRPASSCGIRFGHPWSPESARARPGVEAHYVAVRTFGEAADACITAGDVLLSIGDDPARVCATFGQLTHRLATEPRPFTMRFRKGNGLFITPLHRACENGHDEVVKLLLECNADHEWRDMCGRSAMDRAVRRKNRHSGDTRARYERCIEALADAGASEEGQVRVVDAEGATQPFQLPEHWRHCDEMRLQGRFWLRVEDETSGEVLEHIQRILDRSIGGTGVAKARTIDRRGAVPQKLQVARVQRVENVASLREYLQRRYILREAVSREPVTALQDRRVKVDYSRLCGGRTVDEPLDPELNEVYLFHGTSPSGARGIAHEDFLLNYAGSAGGSAFGRGIYFAEDCIKSDEYTEEAPRGDDFAGLRPLLLCRVLLGRMLVSEDRDVSWEISQVMQSKYDSLVADRRAAVGTYREFIVFDENQASAEYIVWYRRRFS